MCQSKADGGRRCDAHAKADLLAAVNSSRENDKKERTEDKARKMLITPKGVTFFENKGEELLSRGTPVFKEKASIESILGEIKTNEATLIKNNTKVAYSRLYLTEEQKQKFDSFETSNEKKTVYTDAYILGALNRDENKIDANWREDPANFYDRISLPSEHKSLLENKNLPEDYIKLIVMSTEDAEVHKKGVALLKKKGYSDSMIKSLPTAIRISVNDTETSTDRKNKEETVTDNKSNKKNKKSNRIVKTVKRFLKSIWYS